MLNILDFFYKMPPVIETFICRANNENKGIYKLFPATTLREILVYNNIGKLIIVIDYTAIEDMGIVYWLDYLLEGKF